MKKILVITLILVLSIGSTAFATNQPTNYSPVPTEGIPANGNIGSITFYPSSVIKESTLFSTKSSSEDLISSGSAEIEYDSGTLIAFGRTSAAQTSEKVGYDLWIQKWTGDEWKNVITTPFSKIKDNVLVVSGYHSLLNSSATYYRIKIKCIVTNDGVTDYLDGYSPYIEI